MSDSHRLSVDLGQAISLSQFPEEVGLQRFPRICRPRFCSNLRPGWSPRVHRACATVSTESFCQSSPKASEPRVPVGTHILALFSHKCSLWSCCGKIRQGSSIACEWSPSFPLFYFIPGVILSHGCTESSSSTLPVSDDIWGKKLSLTFLWT